MLLSRSWSSPWDAFLLPPAPPSPPPLSAALAKLQGHALGGRDSEDRRLPARPASAGSTTLRPSN